MIRHVSMHRTNDGHIVDMLSGVMKQFADFDAAFAVATKTKR